MLKKLKRIYLRLKLIKNGAIFESFLTYIIPNHKIITLMKKFMLLLALVSFAALGTMNAQCSHAKKAGEKAAVESTDASTTEAASMAASLDENIEKKVCATSGTVSFVKKETCSKSGKVSYSNVEWNDADAKFVNVSPSEKAKAKCSAKEKAKCSAKEKASCASKKGAKATKASHKKGCCSGKAKAACKSKKSNKEG